jgi:hypothetical protein
VFLVFHLGDNGRPFVKIRFGYHFFDQFAHPAYAFCYFFEKGIEDTVFRGKELND